MIYANSIFIGKLKIAKVQRKKKKKSDIMKDISNEC